MPYLSRALTLLLGGLLLAATARAGVNRWTTTGPWGGQVFAIASAPTDPRILYAATARGVFQSLTGGASWFLAAASGQEVIEIVVSRDAPRFVYASTSAGAILRSHDSGETWSESAAPPSAAAISLAVDVLGIAYAGTSDEGIWRSSDEGNTWTRSDAGIPPGDDINDLLTVSSAGLVYAATSSGIYRSGDLGVNWSRVSDIPALDLDADNADMLYAAAFQQGIYFSADGESWQLLEGGPSFPQFSTEVAADPGGGAVWAAGIGRLFRWRSVTGWLEPIPPLLGSAINDIDSATDEHLFLASDRGILRSDQDLGWQELNEGLLGRSMRLLAVDRPGNVVYAAGSGEVARGVSRGGSWTVSRPPGSTAVPCQTDVYELDVLRTPENAPVYAQTYLVNSVRGCPAVGANWTSLDGGASWNLADIARGTLVVDPAEQRVAYRSHDVCALILPPFCGGGTQTIYGTDDGGQTWDQRHYVDVGIPGISLLAIDPADTSIVFGGGNGRLVKSIDGARTWADTSLNIYPSLVLITPTAIFVTDAVDGSLYRSLDDAATWQPVATPPSRIQSLAADPHDPSVLYAGTNGGGIYRSDDHGDTWSSDNAGIETLTVYALEFDATGILYAATDQGVFSRETRSPRLVAPR